MPWLRLPGQGLQPLPLRGVLRFGHDRDGHRLHLFEGRGDQLSLKSEFLIELRHGFRQFTPVGLVIFSYAVVFGILAVNSGLSIAEASLMSLTVFAGASQFLALPMIQSGASVGTLTAMALMVNMRHLLYGLNIGKKYEGAHPFKLLGLSFGIVDETYAFNTLGPGRTHRSLAYFGGTALCAYVTWNAGTFLGAAAGKWTAATRIEGLDFAMLAVFISMIGSSIRKPGDWGVIAASSIVALSVSGLAGGYWHLFAAGLTIPAAASLLGRDGENES